MTEAEEIGRRIAELNRKVVQLYQQGKFKEAIQLAGESRDLTRKHLGEKHPDFAQSLNNLAFLYHAMGNYAAAEPLYKQALDIRRRVLGEEHPDFAQSLNNLAGLYQAIGNYTAAEPLYKQALDIWRRVLGEEHPYTAQGLINLASLYAATDREVEAYALMHRAAVIYDRMIGQVFSIGSESQRLSYLNTIRGNLAAFVSLVSQHFTHSAPEIRAALDLVLRRKAIGAEALAAQRDAVFGGKYPELREQLKELSTLRMQIAQKTLAGPGAEGLQRHLAILAHWTAQKEQLEKELARRIPEMNLEAQFRAADRKAIAQTLPPASILIEYMRLDVFDFKAVPAKREPQWKPAHYLAFGIPAGRPDDVQMVDLGEAEPIDQLIAEFRSSITGEAEGRASAGADISSLADEPGNQLRTAIFDPLVSFIGTSSQLLIASDGNLCTLPFEVLPTGSGERLIDRYHITYLSVGRDVLRFQAESSGQATIPLILADPDFDLSAKGRAAKEGMTGSESRQSRDLDRSHFHFSRLPTGHAS